VELESGLVTFGNPLMSATDITVLAARQLGLSVFFDGVLQSSANYTCENGILSFKPGKQPPPRSELHVAGFDPAQSIGLRGWFEETIISIN
jgi:hypothetical protein